ncbi:hypothetical protein BELL_0832g00060 [Botrytis elliptica]|uniref:Uncharacterized protein n=1 Tax=Botrytis elliptica TaxID=278938 RepID=A0A4Z1JA05_9HELO|nr:hypothetical protein BELL_0832g00060 [Botrytis elliptica]
MTNHYRVKAQDLFVHPQEFPNYPPGTTYSSNAREENFPTGDGGNQETHFSSTPTGFWSPIGDFQRVNCKMAAIIKPKMYTARLFCWWIGDKNFAVKNFDTRNAHGAAQKNDQMDQTEWYELGDRVF